MCVQVRFDLIQRNKISYLTIHLLEKTLSDKDSSFDMTHVIEEESDSEKGKKTQDLCRKPQ